MRKFLAVLAFGSCLLAQEKIAGKWQINVDTPHGPMQGTLDLQQDGAKFKGNCKVPIGDFPLTGTLDGKKIDMKFEMPGDAGSFGLSGTISGDKMSGKTQMGGEWSATRGGSAKSIRGTVTSFHVASLEFGVKPDNGDAIRFRVGPDTEVVGIAPGDTDLHNAKPAKVTDLAIGDRVLVSFVEGLSEARRIVLVNADDIARRNEREKLDWQQRGISGVVAAAGTEEIQLEVRQPGKVDTLVLAVTAKTKIHRYGESQSLEAADIRVGDQVRTRGTRSADGARLIADDIVFGTFVSKVGKVTAVDLAAHIVRMQDIETNQPLIVHVTAASQLRLMPDMRTMFAQHGGPPKPHSDEPFDMRKQLLSLPTGKLEDIKTGTSIVVTSAKSEELTAILLLANADQLIALAQSQAGGGNPLEAISKMHGGILNGPGGLNLPTILQ